MISSWYPRFQQVTHRTIILPLPQSFLDWLLSDSIHLPEDAMAVSNESVLHMHAY